MSERYWYQDGGTVIWAILVAAFLLFLGVSHYQNEAAKRRPMVSPTVVGRIEQPLFGRPSLVIEAWHDHPGVLRNGRLTVSTGGPLADPQSTHNSQSHSFEVWEPNRDKGVSLKFPLKEYDANQEIQVSFELIGKDIQLWKFSDAWQGSGWKSNQK